MAKYLDLWQYSELTDVVVRYTLALEIYAKKCEKSIYAELRVLQPFVIKRGGMVLSCLLLTDIML